MSPYYGSWLDSLMQGSGLMWFGCGKKERIGFAFSDDLELFLAQDGRPPADVTEEDELPHGLSRLFPRAIGRYALADIVRFSGLDSRVVTKKLWDLVWQGLVANDTFAALRQGVLTDFTPAEPRSDRRRPLRSGAGRWGAAQPHPGKGTFSTSGAWIRTPSTRPNPVKVVHAARGRRSPGLASRRNTAMELSRTRAETISSVAA